MLAQRLTQLGVQTDLTKVGADDIAQMAQKAELAKQQAQYAVVYGRAVKSVLTSLVKTTKSQADLYKEADKKLREVDGHKLSMLKSELGHETHMVGIEAKSRAEQQVAQANQASVVEVERARLHGRLLSIGIKHRKAIQAARPKRQGLFSGLWN